MQQGRKESSLRSVIKRWRDDGLIREDEDGSFTKLKTLGTAI